MRGFWLECRRGLATPGLPLAPLAAGEPARRGRIDLAQADAAVLAGVTVPTGPYRALTQIPAEVWLDPAGRSRRIAVLPEPVSGDRQVPIWSVLELWDFGVLTDIVPPGPDAIAAPREAYRHPPPAPAP